MRNGTRAREIETRTGRLLAELIPELVQEKGITGAARELGVSTSNVWYWLIRHGYEIRKVVVKR